ncbi:hypothetical protein P8452_71518 [Trifolium repens]|nr:hypothetical protein P8452_71518 [Trifolium repens]
MTKSTCLWLSWELSSLYKKYWFYHGFCELCANEASVQIGIKSPEANIPQLLPQALIYISHGCESFEKDLFHSTSTK